MKAALRELLTKASQQLAEDDRLTVSEVPTPQLERTRDRAHGDFATTIALILAKQVGRNARAALSFAAGQIITNGLTLLGVSTLEEM